MAELAARLSGPTVANRHLVDAGAALLAVAFLIKAAAWPLNFWLVPAYRAADAARGGDLRGAHQGRRLRAGAAVDPDVRRRAAGADSAADGLLAFGLVDRAAGGPRDARLSPPRRAGGVGRGGLGGHAAGGAGHARGDGARAARCSISCASTLASSAALPARGPRRALATAGATVVDEAPFLNAKLEEASDVNLDDEEAPLVGRPFPASTALLGFAFFACALLIAGLPPLPTFIGKARRCCRRRSRRAAGGRGDGARAGDVRRPCSSAAACIALIALTRTGVRTFWSGGSRAPAARPRGRGRPGRRPARAVRPADRRRRADDEPRADGRALAPRPPGLHRRRARRAR